MYGAFKHPEEDITHDTNINIDTLIPTPAKLLSIQQPCKHEQNIIFSEDVCLKLGWTCQ